jgi:prevent-host-death family protein
MKRATITETKNNLSALIDKVRGGETILVLDRGRPVARIESVSSQTEGDSPGRLERLERQGALLRAKFSRPTEILEIRPPKASASILEALLEERHLGR